MASPIRPVRNILIIVTCALMVSTPIMAANTPPFADAGRDQTVAVGEEIQFHGEGTDEDGHIDLFEWDFDEDGIYDWSSTQDGEATWTYQQVGEHTATFRVTDNDGDTDTDIMVVTVVTGNEPPNADAGEDREVHALELVDFNGVASDPDGEIVSYLWDFNGDGEFDNESEDSGRATWIYSIPDTYYATFKVIDDGAIPANDTSTIKVIVYPSNRPPVVDAGKDVEVHAKQRVRLRGEASDIDGRIVKYEWDLDGDGNFERESGTTPEVLHTYDQPGTYTAILRVTDDAELPSTATDSVQITVLEENQPPEADAGEDITVTVGDRVQFNGNGTDEENEITVYRWDFDNDGTYDWTSSKDANTYHFYDDPGTYTARLNVMDAVGAQANSTRTIVVKKEKKEPAPPLVEFNPNFLIALMIGLGIGAGIGIAALYSTISLAIARKYQKVKELETKQEGIDDPSFRGTQVGEREPPAFRGGDQF